MPSSRGPMVRLGLASILVVTVVGAMQSAVPAGAAAGPRPGAPAHSQAHARTAVASAHGRSRPLRALPITHRAGAGHQALTLTGSGSQPPSSGPSAPTAPAPTGDSFTAPSQNFEGIGHSISGYNGGGTPPDENSDVGASQIVEVVNTSVAVFSKTGTLLHGPVATGSLFSSLGSNPCATRNDGDGVVRYDAAAQRWFIAQFAIPTDAGLAGPNYECVAVSTSADATGSYYVYAFPDEFGGFPDYGKFGVWSDGYYATFNDFTADGSSYLGAVSCAYDRAKMLVGDATATEQCFDLGDGVFGMLPADIDGSTPPPAGTPNFQIALDGYNSGSALAAWRFHVDWATPGNTTITRAPDIPVPSWTGACASSSRNQCIPEPSGGQTLESLGDRLMFPLTYRSFGADGVLTVSHAVNAGSTSGERWYQIAASPTNQLSLAQQGTFAPADSQHRFMGSITSDRANDLALGYSTSSGTTYPDIRYTGRLGTDPTGSMTQAEQTIFSGTGYETTYGRWGDYSSMNVDPVDDCTFWYTNEYYTPGVAYYQWNTRTAAFKNSTCGNGDFGTTLSSGAGTTGAGSVSTTVHTSVSTGTPTSIGLSVSGLPDGATASFDHSSVAPGGSAVLTVHAGTAAAGTYPLVVTGQSSEARHSVEYDVTITNDFHLTLSSTSGTASAPGALSTTVQSQIVSGIAGTVDLSVSGVPSGAVATLGSPSIPSGGSTSLSIDPGTALAGDYPLMVTATDTRAGGATHQATYQLSIVPEVGVALDPTSATAIGPTPVQTTVNTTAGFGGAAPLTLSVTGLPSGATATFSSTAVDAGDSSVLTIDRGSAVPGLYAITVHAHNGAGGGSDATADFQLTIPVDTTAPTLTVHPLPVATIDSSAHLSWSATDADSGVASYRVRSRSAPFTGGFGAWSTPAAWQALTGTTLNAGGLAQGRTYCFAVQATDHAGNVSAWSTPVCTTGALDDRRLTASAHWSRRTGSAWWHGTATISSTRAAALSLAHASVGRLGIVASTCPTCGKVAVYLGSVHIGTINLARPRANRAILLLPPFAVRSGTIRLQLTTSGRQVVIDGVVAGRS